MDQLNGGGTSPSAGSSQEKGTAVSPVVYSCEICGLSGLNDDEMRQHTRQCHVEGTGQCPFCGLNDVLPSDLLLHVNQAHLDYLTPENELMSFIDEERTPSVEGDSDSLSEFAAGSPSSSSKTTYGYTNPLMADSMPQDRRKQNNVVQNNLNNIETTKRERIVPNGATPKKNVEQVNGGSDTGSSIAQANGVQGSPMRSQLGLKLKMNTPKKSTRSSMNTLPLDCPMCNYQTDSSAVLEEHINRAHFDPMSPSTFSNGHNLNNNNHTTSNGNGAHNGQANGHHSNVTLGALQCPICVRVFATCGDLELHVNIEHKDILSPAANFEPNSPAVAQGNGGDSGQMAACPMCSLSFKDMRLADMELHIETHFGKSPQSKVAAFDVDADKEAVRLREERDFEMLRAQYGMDNQGNWNFREQSAVAMQRAVYLGEMSVADYYERQVGLRAAESHGIDDGTSCTKSIAARIIQWSANAAGVTKSLICSGVDHYASNYGDKGWGCGYRNLQMLLSSLLQNTVYNEALYSAWGNHGPSRTAMPSISRLQIMVEAAWNQGFDVQGAEQLGSKVHNTRKWIGATEIVTVLSWLRINCQLVDFHKPTSSDGRHPELFNYVLKYFEEPKAHTPPLYLQHQGHSRTIIGIEERANGLTLLILDPSHGPRQVAALGSNQDSMRLIRRGPAAMKAPQYQIVAIKGFIETKEQYQASKVLRSLRIPPDR